MIGFWFWIPVISFHILQCILIANSNIVEVYSPEKLLEPPITTVYHDYKGQCGVANYCETPESVGCVSGEERRKRGASQGDDYIKLGNSVPKFKYPWMAVLTNKEESGYLFWKTSTHDQVCTGTLISMRHVLTARHCLISEYTGLNYHTAWGVRVAPKETNKLYVLLGADRTLEGPFTFKAEREILQMIIPPKEQRIPHRKIIPQIAHDIALLEIEDVLFSDFIRPICLPIDGIPLGGHYVQAGFGQTAEDGKGSQEEPDALQEIDDVFLDPVLINANETLYDTGGEHLKTHIVNPVDGTFLHNGTGVTHYYYMKDKRTGCDGDSGGPLMWRNPITGRYFIVGVAEGRYDTTTTVSCFSNHTDIVIAFGTKVTYFMEYIYREMRPNTYAYGMCLAPECKEYGNTTWIQNEGSNRYLAPPCGKPKIVDAIFCLKSPTSKVLEDRRRSNGPSKSYYHEHGYTDCKLCPANTDVDWNYNYWLEQITLGSFSQPRYFGVQSPFEMLKTYFDGILSNQAADSCVNYVYGGVRCPRVNNKSVCISGDALCDGILDCPDAWDENPSICTGKCNYWEEHQESSYHWTGGDTDLHTSGVKNAQECHNLCRHEDACDLYQYEKSTGKCQHFTNRINDTSFKNVLDSSGSTYIRGPNQCAEMHGRYKCRRIITPPYRNGAFRIQTFSGRHLQVNTFDRDSRGILVWLSAKRPEIEGKEATRTEWLIKFHGARDLNDSFSTIRSGVSKPRPGLYEEDHYITVRYPDTAPNSVRDGAYVFMSPKLNDEFHDPDQNLDQRLYIRPIYMFLEHVRPEDLVDMAIYSKYKDPVSKTERFIRLFSEPDVEYNYQGIVDWLPDLQLLGGGPIRFQEVSVRDAFNFTQREGRFRLLECDYINPTDHGITEKLPQKYKKNATWFDECIQKDFSDSAMQKDFGISYNRLQRFAKSSKRDALKKLVCAAFRDAHTIWDFAGRMRLTTSGFRRMYHHLEKKSLSRQPSRQILNDVRDYFLQNIPEYIP